MKNQQKENKNPTEQNNEQRFVEEIVGFVKDEFLRRQKERISFERQWELNMKFLSGNQYCKIDGRGEIGEDDLPFFWQSKGVFNHIAPIIESRLARFSRVTPVLSVMPKSNDDDDVQNSIFAERLIKEAFKRTDMADVVNQVTAWSETCGSAFYKIVWDNLGGRLVGTVDGENVYEGEVKVLPVSPFEIFPDSIYTEKMSDLKSLIHARVVSSAEIYEKYKVKLIGSDVGVYDLTEKSLIKTGSKNNSNVISDSLVVIEYYEKPTETYPKGRLITVADDTLLYYGDLPYKNTSDGYGFPFAKQDCINVSGCFFGKSIIDRLIPVQRAFNALKNRKHEFLNRLSMGIMSVEDGSIDLDDLENDGLKPGKILVYRQGSNPPEMMDETTLPQGFSDEEDKLLNEFVVISGVSDVSSSQYNSKLMSGSALELLVNQDNERMTVHAERIRRCYVEVAKQVLSLYAQFISGVRAVNYTDTFGKIKVCYATEKTATSGDVYLQSENELLYTPKQKKEMLLKLFESGMLADKDGNISVRTKEKLLTLFGYDDLDYNRGLSQLHEEKAQAENVKMRSKYLDPTELDDHQVHVTEHVRYFLNEFEDLNENQKQNYISHVKKHKEMQKLETSEKIEKTQGEK